MSKGQLGNFSTMSGGEFSVAGGATDDWYISKGAQYRWGFIAHTDYLQCMLGTGSNNQNGNLRWFLPLGIDPPL